MKNSIAVECLMLLGLITTTACALEPPTEEELAEVEGTAEALTLPSPVYNGQGFVGAGSNEASAHCDRRNSAGNPTNDEVLTGFGGRVDSSGNFTNIKVWCRTIGAGGFLSGEASYGSGEESVVHAPGAGQDGFINGAVVVGVGGIVSSDNLTRAVIRICPWNPSTRKVGTGGLCVLKASTTASTSFELLVDSHAGQPIITAERRVAVGVGLTASGDNLSGVRLEWGSLTP